MVQCYIRCGSAHCQRSEKGTRMIKYTVFIGLLVLVGCVNQPTPEERRAGILSYVAQNKRPDNVKEAMLENRLVKGMLFKDVARLWGPPQRVNRASYGTQAIWQQYCPYARSMFQDNIYVYFDGDVVTDWQRNDCIN